MTGGLLLLLVIALCYYGIYWRCGLRLSGEEGVAGMIAQRLNAGERPFVDTFLGYNLGWFYPIAWLFKVTGPNYLVMRVYFFFLGFLAGIAAYTTVWITTRRNLLAFATGLLVILMPGVIGRNYMALLGMLGILTILGAFILPARRKIHRLLWIVAASLAISLTWLIRIDLGFFQTALFLLTSLLFVLKPEQGYAKRLGIAGMAAGVLIAIFCLTQGAVYHIAEQRGFGRQFFEQYWVWPKMIQNAASQVSGKLLHPTPTTPEPSTVRTSNAPAIMSVSPSEAHSAASSQTNHDSKKEASDLSASYNDASLKRPPLRNIFTAPLLMERVNALLIFLPLLVSFLFISLGFVLFLSSLFLKSEALWEKGALLLVSTGGALVLFPQYFFWRPDMIHLAEFMAPFMVALVLGLFLVTSSWKKRTFLRRLLLLAVILPAALNLGIYIFKGWQTDGTGSFAASRKRHLDFTASNGVHVKLNAAELARDTLLRDTIMRYSHPGDYVICYPYYPTVNFMTDRPSYEYNLYADNALAPDLFYRQAIENMERHHPAVIVIGTGKINATEASRFCNWASGTYAYIKGHFALVASDDELEIYARKSAKEINPKQATP